MRTRERALYVAILFGIVATTLAAAAASVCFGYVLFRCVLAAFGLN